VFSSAPHTVVHRAGTLVRPGAVDLPDNRESTQALYSSKGRVGKAPPTT